MGVELLRFTCGSFQAPLTFFLGGEDQNLLTSPVPAYLIRHPDKGMAIFDTGLHHRFRREIDAQLGPEEVGFDFREGDELAARLRAAGIDPADVRWVINSHLHADHCGGNGAFPNATIVIQRKELDFARAHIDGMLYADDDFETGQSFLAVDGEYDLWGDGSLILFPTYGHTPGHQSARVHLASGDVVLTSDCCYLARNLDELVISPGNFDREMSLDVLRRLRSMRERGTRMLFGHDPDQWQGVSQGTVLR
jgi:glyoxylase-like metal-dependent hydrolase (beta-lactamase superfamily II)